jgi:hypothetical protein
MANTEKLFWDSCVLNAFLYDEGDKYDIAHIKQFLDEARNDRLYDIYASSISLAEFSNKKLKVPNTGSLIEFFADYTGHINVIDPTPNIIILAGRLRELRYTKSPDGVRVLSVPDAIMLATCLNLQDAFGVKIDVFHTFDDGKKGGTPLLSFHDWCNGFTDEDDALTKRVCALRRQKPIHPRPELPLTPTRPEPKAAEPALLSFVLPKP